MSDAAPPETVQPDYRVLQVGDPVPWFKQNSTNNPNFSFDTVAGRYIVLCFYGMGSDEVGRATLASFQDEHRPLFDDDKIALFGVSVDPSDQSEGRARQIVPGIRHFWDFDGTVGRLYGALPRNVQPGQGPVPIRRFWMVLNPSLRVRAVLTRARDLPVRGERQRLEENGSDREKVMAYLRDLPPVSHHAGFELPAPVLVIPDVFEPEFCRHLIGLYEEHGGEESGFMREVDGKTVAAHDPNHKGRKDYTIDDPNLIRQVQHRIIRRINPEIERVHFFKPSRMERYIVSCYAAQDGGHFRAHRDNTTSGTAHRRFAVSINLNHDFEGGEVSFPEYGPRSYKASPGGAVVFSCPLLHAVSKVTKGRRFAFLPFLYDEEAAKVREANNAKLGEGVGAYRA